MILLDLLKNKSLVSIQNEYQTKDYSIMNSEITPENQFEEQRLRELRLDQLVKHLEKNPRDNERLRSYLDTVISLNIDVSAASIIRPLVGNEGDPIISQYLLHFLIQTK